MNVENLRVRARLGTNFFQLIKAVKRRRQTKSPVEDLEKQIGDVNIRLKELGGILTESERQRLRGLDSQQDYEDNLLPF